MATNLNEIFADLASLLEDLSKSINKDCSSYQFESSFHDIFKEFEHSVYQQLWGYTKIEE